MAKKKTHLNLEDSHKILESTRESSSSLFAIFDKEKGARKGPPTDREQDILRGTLLLVCAGLDSFFKQMVEDTLETIKTKNKKSKDFFTREAAIFIKDEETDKVNIQVIADALMSGDPQSYFVKRIKNKLSGKSLQNYGELKNVLEAFGLEDEILVSNKDLIKKMFDTRNLIAHDFDYDFSVKAVGIKHRSQRGIDEIREYTELSIKIMQSVFDSVDRLLVGDIE